ncbi:hypothetical protein Patl1_06552 [Pistacia atlantica]|uniref:Uncharacterized protein n=1 Tax=Pistacia atlantica TaxID=434234 RepID=A0ACC1BQN4_9ROSI|nr:hypothetical protein Patl1_06552 [Pistacia atlantica]
MASPEEVKDVVDREGSFAIEQLDTFYIENGDKAIWDLARQTEPNKITSIILGVIPEEKLDSFNVPYYIPSEKEVKNIVDREGSFELEVLETFPIEMGDKSVWSSDEKFIKNLRSFTESMVSHHFGGEILDKLYDKFAQIVLQDLATRTEPSEVISFVVVLRRL